MDTLSFSLNAFRVTAFFLELLFLSNEFEKQIMRRERKTDAKEMERQFFLSLHCVRFLCTMVETHTPKLVVGTRTAPCNFKLPIKP